jgi:carboxyl-terminal processing protease
MMSGEKKLVFKWFQSSQSRSRTVLVWGLLFALFAGHSLNQKIERGAKSTDQYWHETGLSSRELELLLGPASCLQNHRNFLGCVNAISAMAERYDLVLERSGELAPMTPEAIERRLTERKELKAWEESFGREEMSPKFSFLELWKSLDSSYVQRDERSAVIAAGINAFLSVTKDPHSYILPLSFYEEVISRSDIRPLHLGFVSKRVKGGAYVRKVFAESPASLAGLRKGDRILEVNGIGVARLHPTQYSDLMKVRSGDRIRLRIERRDHHGFSQRYIEIIKSDVVFPNVLAKMIGGRQNVGLITVHKFARETCVSVQSHIQSLKQEGMRGLILDLRDNPGGQVDEAACVIGLFVDKGKDLFETRYLDPTRPVDRYKSEREPVYRGPLTVLINGGSASASEIVAGSLKDLGRATLVGERSFGKGSFQDGHLWAANPRVAFFETEGLYYFPSGWTPQLVGLEPDVKVTSAEDESLREVDLYYNPMRPADLWNGPQTLAWMADEACSQVPLSFDDDPQIEKAWALMNCDNRSGNHDRHGTL